MVLKGMWNIGILLGSGLFFLWQVYKIVFNMKEYGANTLKPTMLLSNSRALRRLSKASGTTKSKKSSGEPKPSLCRKYVDSKGRPRFHGTKALKRSQTFGLDRNLKFLICLLRCFEFNRSFPTCTFNSNNNF